MEARLPKDKLTRVYHTVTNWLDKQNATNHKILSLVDLLQHAAKVVRSDLYAGCIMLLQKGRKCTQLIKNFHSDLYWWHTFVTSWNGISFLQIALADPTPQVTIQTCIGHVEM